MQHHVVFGAGLIGCYIGASLRLQGNDVDLICRPRIQQKLLHGVTLTDYKQHQALANGFTFNQALQGNSLIDVIWLTVKCTDVSDAVLQLRDICQPHTVIICCQNGLGSDAEVKRALPNNTVLKAMVPFNVVEIKDDHLHRGSEGALMIEREADIGKWVDDLCLEIHSDLLPVGSCENMQSLLWAKLQLNLGNSINALADIPVKAMLQQKPYRLVIAAMMKELLAVTKKMGIQLPKVTSVPAAWIPNVLSLPNWMFTLLANKMLDIDPNVRTSMWWDIANGRQTEIDHLNGAIVKAGERMGVDCVVNKKVTALIKAREMQQTPKQLRAISADVLYKKVIGH
jgi:2-dehydropantoate 2-reductase